MSDLVLQGIATATGQCFFGKDGNVLYLKHGCFDASIISGLEVRLLLDHDSKSCLAKTTNDKLEVCAGATGIAFRFHIPDSCSGAFRGYADDFDSYLPVSIGFKDGIAEAITIDGVKVTSVINATLCEVSILSKPPAIHSTYGRVVSANTCGPLKDDYDSGRLALAGRYVALHRAYKASHNNGVVEYCHSTSAYDRTASKFETALRKLQ